MCNRKQCPDVWHCENSTETAAFEFSRQRCLEEEKGEMWDPCSCPSTGDLKVLLCRRCNTFCIFKSSSGGSLFLFLIMGVLMNIPRYALAFILLPSIWFWVLLPEAQPLMKYFLFQDTFLWSSSRVPSKGRKVGRKGGGLFPWASKREGAFVWKTFFSVCFLAVIFC